MHVYYTHKPKNIYIKIFWILGWSAMVLDGKYYNFFCYNKVIDATIKIE